jgi:SAM-dependent methyltransferase
MPTAKQVVRRGYNRISESYRNDRGEGPDSKYPRYWLKEIDKRLPAGSRILDLGCGMGVPVARHFSRNYSYLGVDISSAQVRRAKKLIPKARFQCADMAALKFKPSSFDAVVSFYAVIHLPLGEQRPLFHGLYRWLKPGGVFLSTLGWGKWTGMEKDWFGTRMFWSHADQGTYQKWLEATGFRVIRKGLIREGKSGHFQFLCVKPKIRAGRPFHTRKTLDAMKGPGTE